MSVTHDRLAGLLRAAPSSPRDLFQLLVEGLDWPIPDGLDLQDEVIPYDPSELQLDPDKVAKLRTIQQIPPLTSGQRFGVFLLHFDSGRLPVGAIRRLVDRLARTKRARTSDGRLPAWKLDDLLFFCQSSSAEKMLHVVAFRETDNKRILKVLSWGTDSTPARLDLVARRGVPELSWHEDGPRVAIDLGGRSGFTGYRQAIRSAAALATRMAEVAVDVRDEVLAMYEVETADGPIRQLYNGLRRQLIADLTPERFADVYAQTMVYGLLTARITHPERFREDASLAALDFENPFLDAIYARFRHQSEDVLDIDELGLASSPKNSPPPTSTSCSPTSGPATVATTRSSTSTRTSSGIRPRTADRAWRLLHTATCRRTHRSHRRSTAEGRVPPTARGRRPNTVERDPGADPGGDLARAR